MNGAGALAARARKRRHADRRGRPALDPARQAARATGFVRPDRLPARLSPAGWTLPSGSSRAGMALALIAGE